jgi:AraC-like DNA-binding protein
MDPTLRATTTDRECGRLSLPIDRGQAPAESLAMASLGQQNSRSGAKRMLARRYDYLPDRIRTVIRSSRMDDYAFESFDGASPYPELESVTSLGHPWHYRIQYASSYARGQGEFCGLADGFFVNFSDCELAEPLQLLATAEDMLRIRIGDKGRGEYCVDDGHRVDIDGPSALLIIDPPGAAPAHCGVEGPYRAVQLYISRPVLRALFEGDEDELPDLLQSFLDGTLDHSVVRRLPLSPALLRCMEDLLGCDSEGRTRRYYIQSKAMEILCQAFDALGDDEAFGAAEASAVTARGVHRAQAILIERFISPPSLDHLAAEVGLSRTSLTVGFRRILGQSVFDYIHDLRMQHALTLLRQPDSSVTQVAYAVGYNHVSSFSVAVHRRFGATPSELRRQGALPG